MLWWLARSTSLIALVLLTVSLTLGIAAGRGRPESRVVVQRIHREASALAVVLIGVHVATLVIDPHVDLGLVDIVVPFGSGFSRLATGLGTVALDMLITVAVTSVLRVRLSARVWRAIHAMAYALWPVAALHGVGAGTDVVAVRRLTLACAAAVGLAVAYRLTRARSIAASVLAVVCLAVTGALAGAVVG
jgi:sulfoxide reductase heme-binding subunit YedZ